MKRITYVLALGLFAMGALATAQESVPASQPVATFVASINDYRIVGNDLVLVDVHASLVVDILPNALGSSDVPIAWPQR